MGRHHHLLPPCSTTRTRSFRMWYGATDGSFGQGTAGYAESPDGSLWTKHVGQPSGRARAGNTRHVERRADFPRHRLQERRLLPHVVHRNRVQRRGVRSLAGRPRHVERRVVVVPVHPTRCSSRPDPWEGTRVYNIEVVRIGDAYGMWYTGVTAVPTLAYVGYAVSPDGIHWGKWPDNPVILPLVG